MPRSYLNEPDVIWHQALITREMRKELNGHRSAIVWLTGLSGSGKSTIAHALESCLYETGCRSFVFDGDNVRHGLCSDLTFSEEDRHENLRRIGEMAKLFLEAGIITITAFISPFRNDRQQIRSTVPHGDFLEIYCNASLEVCEQRDVKGLYAKARAGKIGNYTGISSPYEKPKYPELELDTANDSVEDCVESVINLLKSRGIKNINTRE